MDSRDRRHHQQPQNQHPTPPDEVTRVTEEDVEKAIEEEIAEVIGELSNPWRPIEEAPKDRIVEGRFSKDEEVGRPIRWRFSRRREGHRWVTHGVWHAAETAGAVQLRPIEWREWEPVGLHFDVPEEAA